MAKVFLCNLERRPRFILLSQGHLVNTNGRCLSRAVWVQRRVDSVGLTESTPVAQVRGLFGQRVPADCCDYTHHCFSSLWFNAVLPLPRGSAEVGCCFRAPKEDGPAWCSAASGALLPPQLFQRCPLRYIPLRLQSFESVAPSPSPLLQCSLDRILIRRTESATVYAFRHC